MDEQLTTLARAETVAFGPVGFAAKTLPETQAYLDLADALDRHARTLRPQLERLLTEATPAGRVYAADLLYKLDPVAGRDAWYRLAADRSPLSTFAGCVMGRTTVAEYAAHHDTLGG